MPQYFITTICVQLLQQQVQELVVMASVCPRCNRDTQVTCSVPESSCHRFIMQQQVTTAVKHVLSVPNALLVPHPQLLLSGYTLEIFFHSHRVVSQLTILMSFCCPQFNFKTQKHHLSPYTLYKTHTCMISGPIMHW